MQDLRVKFGSFELLTKRGLLLKNGVSVRLGSRALAILTELLEHPGEVVSSDALIRKVWPDTFVDEANLRVNLGTLRKAITDDSTAPPYILNIPGRGYRFTGLAIKELISDTDDQRPCKLPPMLTELIGREESIQRITAEFSSRRLITILGPGGIGKTSVAIALAHGLASNFSDGACFFDLSPLREPTSLPGMVQALLGLAVEPDRSFEELIAYLRSREVLFVFDNCEHLLERVSVFTSRLLKDAPSLKILATSREPMRIEGEWPIRLDPLPYPDTSARRLSATEALMFPAVRLFFDRARLTLNSFDLRDEDVADVALLCRRLDGIPLAIELAAARVDLFSIRSLSHQLTEGLSLLSKGLRAGQARHQALHATLDWSFELLSAEEQAILCRLSIFRGAFSRDAALAVAGDKATRKEAVQEGLAKLASKSLVTAGMIAGAVQYRLLETTRLYAVEKLNNHDDRERVCHRHAEHFLTIFSSGAEGDLPEAVWLSRYGGMLDDVRGALDWAFSNEENNAVGLGLTAASAPLWIKLSLSDEYMSRLKIALKIIDRDAVLDLEKDLRINLAIATTIFSLQTPSSRLLPMFCRRALTDAEALGDLSAQVRALWMLFSNRMAISDSVGALKFAQRVSKIAVVLKSEPAAFLGHRITAYAKFIGGDFAGARDEAELAINPSGIAPDFFRASALKFDQNLTSRAYLAQTLWIQGACDRAVELLESVVQGSVEFGDPHTLCHILTSVAIPLTLWGDNRILAREYLDLLTDWAITKTSLFFLNYSRLYEAVLSMRENRSSELPVLARLQIARSDLLQRQIIATLLPEVADLAVNQRFPDRTIWCTSEILRGKGLSILRSSPAKHHSDAKVLFEEAKQIAHAQGALAWELRAATDLASLMMKNGDEDEAQNLLAEVANRFTEGFHTPDFKRAQGLLTQRYRASGAGRDSRHSSSKQIDEAKRRPAILHQKR